MEQTNEKVSFYKRFMDSKAFYPVMLSLIAALCVSIWAINRSNKMVLTTAPLSTAGYTAGDFLDEPTTAIQNTTAAQATTAAKSETSEKPTYAYENNKAYQGEWVLPVHGDIGKDYSAGTLVKSATMGDYRVHNGIDIIAKQGTAVVAANSGKVLDIYTDAFWGTVAVVDHGDGVLAKYCGLGKEVSAQTQKVLQKGDKIGTVGFIPCEQKDESHFHLEMTVNGEVQDPIAVMNMLNGKE